jgi:hypothetical protein
VPETMKAVALMFQSGFEETPLKDHTGRGIAHRLSSSGIEEILLEGVSFSQPRLQGPRGII